MRKLISIGIIVLAVVLLGIVLYLLFRGRVKPTLPPGTSGTTPPSTPFPQTPSVPSPTVVPTDDTFVIQTSEGGVVVRNFYKDNPPMYGSNVMLRDTSEYHIEYVRDNGQFLIALLAYTSEEAATARKKAEADLLQLLSVSRDTICSLDIWVSVPASYSETLAGTDYGLSFCPGAVAL